MLDRTDFASWQQRIRLYCRGKDNGVNILNSIDEGPYILGTFRETLAESTEGTLYFGPERPRVYSDLNSNERDRYNADIRVTNILLQRLPKDIYTLINHYTNAKDIWDNVKMLLEGSELTKEDRESQLVVVQNVQGRPNRGQGMNPWGGNAVGYGEAQNRVGNVNQGQARPGQQHEAHAKENKIVLERLSQPIAQPTADPLALLSNVSNTKHGLPSSSTSNQATVQDGRVVVQNVQRRPNRGQGMNPWGGNAAGYEEAHNRVGNVNQGQARPGQARRVKCYNCNGTGHIARNCTQPKRPQNSEYFKDKMLLMQAQENGVALDAEHQLFLAGGPGNAFDDDVDEQPVQDLALNVDNVFQAEDCDAFDSDVDEAPTAQTMFMANLSSVDPITDEAGPSYDSDILSEVRDHDHYLDDTCAYQEEHVMHDSVQLDHVVDLHADQYQYVKDIDVSVVHNNASSVPNDTFMMIYDDMCESITPSVSNSSRNAVVKNSLTAELATYREQVKLPRPLYNDLNKVAIGYKNPLCLTHAKQAQPALYNGHEILKDNHARAKVHNTEDTLEIAEITRKKMNAKMTDSECVTHKVKIVPHDYSKENLLATFTPQKQLTPEQIYWSNDLMTLKFEALKERAKVSRPIKAFTMYPLNTPAMLVPRVLPTTSQVIHIFILIQQFLEFDKTCKKRITPSAITDGERDKETLDFDSVFVIGKMQASLLGKDNAIRQLKKQLFELQATCRDTECTFKVRTTESQLTKVADPVTNLQAQNDRFRTENDKVKQHYKQLYNSIKITRAKHIEQVTKLTAKNMTLKTSVGKAKVQPSVLTRTKHAVDVDLIVPRLRNNRESVETIRDIVEEAKVYWKSPPTSDKETPDFDSVFVIGKMQASLLGKDNAIRQLKKQLSDKAKVQPLVLRRTKHAVDVELIVPRLRNNRDAHLDYLRHLKESVEIIRDIVEEAKVVRPLDRSIVSACRYTQHSQELLEYAIDTCPQGSQQRAKQLDHTPLLRKKQDTVTKPSNRQDSNKNKHVVTQKTQETNVHVPHSTGVKRCPKAGGSQPKSNHKTNRISPAKGDNKLPVEDLPRTNKSYLRTTNRVDSNSRLKRT
nr:hypothetical protein [Tanacetum cinerariifolium]